MQTRSPIFDDLAQLLTSAAGAAQGVREEVETLVRAQVERAADQLDLVPREDFEAVREMAVQALSRVEALESEVESLKRQVGAAPKAKKMPAAKTKSSSKSTD
jgi:BMFP domain-containing protein YqiC